MRPLGGTPFAIWFLFWGAVVQGQTASIFGTVTDTNGGLIANGKVTAKNIEIGLVRRVLTSGSGVYSIPNLPVGRYDVTVQANGFATATASGVVLTVAQAQTVNATLQPGQITQTIEVSENGVAPVELENAQISNIVTQRQIQDLPLLTRNPYDLVSLSAGTMQSNTSLGGFSVNGSRERNNNFLVDGVDNNDTSTPGLPGGLISLNPDATAEFRVITNNFLPEYGRNTGAVVDLITRSGSNEYHGNAYWFGRYNALAARDFFNIKGTPQNPFVRNDLGTSFGGRIVKNRTFFFVNEEWQRFRTTITNASIVPTAAFKSGKFTIHDSAGRAYRVDLTSPGSPNNPLSLKLDPNMQKVFALLPDPNGEAVDDVRAIYRFPSTSKLDTASVAFKLDHRLSEKHNLAVRYSYSGASDPNSGYREIAPGLDNVIVNAQTHAVLFNLNSVFTPTVLNEFRFGVNRLDAPFSCGGLQAFDQLRAADAFGAGSDFNVSGIISDIHPVIGCFNLGDSNGQTRRTGTYNVYEAFTKIYRSHTIKLGIEFRHIFENGANAFGSRPLLTFNAFDTYGLPIVNVDPNSPCNPNTGSGCFGRQLQNMTAALFGLVDTQTQSQFFDRTGQRMPTNFRRFRYNEYAGFAQDSWKVWPNLTISYGFRYQFNGVPFEADNNLSNLFANPAGQAPFVFTIVGPGTGHQLFANDYSDIEPRVGFSWDPFRTGRTSVRGGYGIFHDRLYGNIVSNSVANPPFQNSYFESPSARTQLAAVPLPAMLLPLSSVADGDYITPSLMDPNFRMPTSQNWNIGVQRELRGKVTAEVNYVGSKANHLLRVLNGNPPQPVLVQQVIDSGVSPARLQGYPALYETYQAVNNTALYIPSLNKSIANSTYHSLQINISRRLERGLTFQAAYTWSHAIDDASDPLVAAQNNRNFPRNSLNLRQERGNSDFDLRHRLIVNYGYEFPVGTGRAYMNRGVVGKILEGWQLTGFSTWQSGHPYDIFSAVDSEHAGSNSRADLIADPSIRGSDRTQTWPLFSAFANPAFGRPGTLGRNVFTGPTYIDTDIAIYKNTSVNERFKTQLRVEVYNLFNRPQFLQPGNLLSNPDTFGVSTGTLVREDGTTSARQLQLALKLIF